ncbi:MAG: tetratricopeptide repeat protein [Cyclobacteriaceae bacterium]
MRKSISAAVLFFIFFQSFSQNTLPENKGELLFSRALDLHNKGLFQASRAVFEKYLDRSPDGQLASSATYYVALNAISNDEKDGEVLMNNFIASNSGHPKTLTAYFDLGKYYFGVGDYKKAAASFGKVTMAALDFSSSMEGYFKLGYSQFQNRDKQNALNNLLRAAQVRNEFYEDAGYYAGFIQIEQSDFNSAIENLEKAEKNPKYKDLVPELITTAYYNSKQFKELINYSKPYLQSGNGQVVLLTAESHYNLNEYQKAADLYDKAIKNSRRKMTPSVYYHDGYSNYKVGKNQKAIEAFKNAGLATDTLGQYASYYLGLLYTQTDEKQFALNAFEEASRLDFNESIAEEALFRKGQLEYEQEQFAASIATLQNFIETYPQSDFRPKANDLLSDAFLKTNNYDLAINYIESLNQKSESLRRTYQHVTLLKGAQLFNDRRFQRSIEFFNKSLTTQVDQGKAIEAYYWNGEAYSIGKKWPEAISAYSRIVFNTAYRSSPFYIKARYGLGYAYYNTKVYERAKFQFAEYTKALERAPNKQQYLDALVRLADCYFVEKSYPTAISNYEKALASGSRDMAYIHLQLGLSHGFANNNSEAKSNFRMVIEKFPQSNLMERAAYQLAQLDFENGNFADAISEFTFVINRFPNSPLMPSAYVKRALSSFNVQNYQNTAIDYQFVLDNFPSHELANSALLGLQEVAVLLDNGLDVDAYIEKYRQANPEDGSLESIEFEAAKTRYFSQDYTGAIQKLNAYLAQYPESSNKGDVLYFIADSYYRSEQPVAALDYFNQVLEYPQITYFNRAVLRLASLELDQKNFKNSIKSYKQLLAISKNRREAYNAREGLLKAYFHTAKFDSVIVTANEILSDDQVSTQGRAVANLFIGKAHIQKRQFDKAGAFLNTTIGLASDENAAEASYLIGLALNKQEKFQDSNLHLFEFNKNYSTYELWLGRSFLLIADNYIALEELFQAKATLNSIVENSPIATIQNQAAEKLLTVQEMEDKVLGNNLDSAGQDSTQNRN